MVQCFVFLFNVLRVLSSRDQSQIVSLAKQIRPRHTQFVSKVYAEATKAKYGYLIIDVHPSQQDSLRYSPFNTFDFILLSTCKISKKNRSFRFHKLNG